MSASAAPSVPKSLHMRACKAGKGRIGEGTEVGGKKKGVKPKHKFEKKDKGENRADTDADKRAPQKRGWRKTPYVMYVGQTQKRKGKGTTTTKRTVRS